MPTLPSFPLNDSNTIPAIGVGCWMGEPGGADDVREMVERALKIGYRHIDTALGYNNEQEVGAAIRNSGVPREQIYLVTKLWHHHHHNVEEGLDLSLKNLGVNYVDLYLMHWPQARDPKTGLILQPGEHPTYVETWKAMEKLLETGKVKSIGVSNFSIKTLDVLLPEVDIVPAVNQVEMHPLLPQLELLEYSRKRGIVLTAYTPLGKGHPDLIEHPALKEITSRTGSTTGQVIMGWFVKKGVVAVPKSANPTRLRQNLDFVEISAEDEVKIDAIHTSPGMHRSMIAHLHEKDGGTMFGWTYEQLGWPFKPGGLVA